MADTNAFSALLFDVAGYLRGRHTPIDDRPDPETRAKLMERYIGMLTKLDQAEAGILQETIKTYGDVKASMLNTYGAFANALAEAEKAGAMSAQAGADMFAAFRGRLSELQANYAFMEPDPKFKERSDVARQVMWDGAVLNESGPLSPAGIATIIENAKRGDAIDGAAVEQGIAEALLASPGFAAYLDLATEINKIPDPNTKAFSAISAEQNIQVAIESVLARAEADAVKKGIEPGALTGASGGRSMSDRLMARLVTKHFTGQIAGTTRGADGRYTGGELDAARTAQATAKQDLQRLDDEALSLMHRGGLPSWITGAFRDAIEADRDLLASPKSLAEAMVGMPSPADYEETRGFIKDEMKRILYGTPDPLNKAVAEYATSVPGFAEWTAAHRFPDTGSIPRLERAVIYAVGHPGEISGFLRASDGLAEIPPAEQIPGLMANYWTGQKQAGERVDLGKFGNRMIAPAIKDMRKDAREAKREARQASRTTPPPEKGLNEGAAAETIIEAMKNDRAKVRAAADAMPTGDPVRADLEAWLSRSAAGPTALPGAPTSAGSTRPADATDMLVYKDGQARMAPVSSPHLVHGDAGSYVVEMPDGYAYQRTSDGNIVILQSPIPGAGSNAGARLRPGDEGWVALSQEINRAAQGPQIMGGDYVEPVRPMAASLRADPSALVYAPPVPPTPDATPATKGPVAKPPPPGDVDFAAIANDPSASAEVREAARWMATNPPTVPSVSAGRRFEPPPPPLEPGGGDEPADEEGDIDNDLATFAPPKPAKAKPPLAPDDDLDADLAGFAP